METYEAYCSVCAANVRVTLDPEAEHPLAHVTLECLERDASCEGVSCPFDGATARELSELLEFLPSEAREEGEGGPGVADAEETLRRGRIQAMRRGHDPVE